MPRDMGSLDPIDYEIQSQERPLPAAEETPSVDAAPVLPPEDDMYSGSLAGPLGDPQGMPVQPTPLMTHDDMQRHTPDTVPVPPPSGDFIRAYLESKLNLPQGPDPKLAQAQMEEKIDRAANSIGRAAGGLGTAITGGAAGFANQVAGKGYDTSGGMQNPVQAYDDKASPVQRYMQSKLAEQQASKANLEDAQTALAAHKAMLGQDPNSIEVANLQLRREQLEREKARDAELARHQGVAEGHNADSLEETKRWHDRMAVLRANGMSQRDAFLQIQREKIEQNDTRIHQGQERLDRDTTDRTLPGAEGDFSKGDVKDLKGYRGNTIAAVENLHALSGLRDELSLNGVLPTDSAAKFETLYHALQPVINGAEFKTAWNAQHGKNFSEQLRSPEDLRSWLNKDYFRSQVDEVIKTLQSNYAARVRGAGGDVYSQDVTSPESNAPGRSRHMQRGVAAGKNVSAPPENTDAMVTVVQKKTGQSAKMKASDAAKFRTNPDYEVR